jgi:hypothetical protein
MSQYSMSRCATTCLKIVGSPIGKGDGDTDPRRGHCDFAKTIHAHAGVGAERVVRRGPPRWSGDNPR